MHVILFDTTGFEVFEFIIGVEGAKIEAYELLWQLTIVIEKDLLKVLVILFVVHFAEKLKFQVFTPISRGTLKIRLDDSNNVVVAGVASVEST